VTPAIVIFGAAVRPGGRPSGTLRRRVEAAIACADRLERPLFVPTGGIGRFGPSESAVMRDLLLAAGISAERILPEPTGTDTLSSARAVRNLLRARSIGGPVYVATSRYHMLRCVLLLRLAGIDARPCMPPRQPMTTSLARRWYWRLREVPATPYDALLMVWFRATRRL